MPIFLCGTGNSKTVSYATKQAILPAKSYPQLTYISPEAAFRSHDSGGNDISEEQLNHYHLRG